MARRPNARLPGPQEGGVELIPAVPLSSRPEAGGHEQRLLNRRVRAECLGPIVADPEHRLGPQLELMRSPSVPAS
jgi:hypothetical protein